MARYAPLVPLVAGAALLIAAEFVTVREIRAVTAVPPGGTETGGGMHGYALAIVALAMLPFGFGAVVRRARPAAVALVALALVACGIVLLADLPALDDTGSIGTLYELAEAHPATGFYLESVGAALALIGAVAALALSRSSAQASRARGRPGAARAPRRPARAGTSPPRGGAGAPPPPAE